jgi:hypothetical protein
VGFWGGAAGEGVAWEEEGVGTEEVVGGGGWGVGPGDGVISSSVYSRASVAFSICLIWSSSAELGENSRSFPLACDTLWEIT